MNRLQSIVVGVDFTPRCAGALRQAIRIAEWNRATLHVVHIVEMLLETDPNATLTDFQQDIRAGLVRAARKAWCEFVTDIPEASGLDLQIEINHPVAAMMRRVRDHSADLLVLGTHGCSEPTGGAGTLATACVRKAMTKVMLVRDLHAGPFRSVLACVDFSETSETALQQAARVAIQDSARLHILHVFQGPCRSMRFPAQKSTMPEACERQYRDGLLRRLVQFGGWLRDEMPCIVSENHVLDSPRHGNGIIEFAGRVDADLIVLGTRGRTNLRDILWGRTAERVVRNTPCSILTVKPAGFEHPLGAERARTSPQ